MDVSVIWRNGSGTGRGKDSDANLSRRIPGKEHVHIYEGRRWPRARLVTRFCLVVYLRVRLLCVEALRF